MFFVTLFTSPITIKLILAFLTGFIPVLIWLWFWEHEDKHPEPLKLIFFAFVGGMAAVIAALFLEELTCVYWAGGVAACDPVPPTQILIVWAVIEELLKFGVAYILVLSRAENDEPIDSVMYMIAVALGFAALENAFYLYFGPISNGIGAELIAISNVRFVGATVLHTVASSVIGLSLAFSFYKDEMYRFVAVILGVITAIILHATFNLTIMAFEGNSAIIIPFYAIWLVVIIILLTLEKVKNITKLS